MFVCCAGKKVSEPSCPSLQPSKQKAGQSPGKMKKSSGARTPKTSPSARTVLPAERGEEGAVPASRKEKKQVTFRSKIASYKEPEEGNPKNTPQEDTDNPDETAQEQFPVGLCDTVLPTLLGSQARRREIDPADLLQTKKAVKEFPSETFTWVDASTFPHEELHTFLEHRSSDSPGRLSSQSPGRAEESEDLKEDVEVLDTPAPPGGTIARKHQGDIPDSQLRRPSTDMPPPSTSSEQPPLPPLPPPASPPRPSLPDSLAGSYGGRPNTMTF